jgi:SAM-dependent methyltransferase
VSRAATSSSVQRPEAYEAFERIFELDAQSGGAMRAYLGFGPEDADVRRFVRYVDDIIAVSGRSVSGARMLDAGCGYGLFLVVCAAEGAPAACGVDIDATPLRFAQRYRGLLPESLSERLSFEAADVADLPYEDRSFDLVTCVEAISHYLDVDAALNEFARVLRPGGVLVVSDGNNALNRRYAETIRTLWQAAEDGPGHRNVGGHSVGTPYRQRRAEIIRDHAPDLPEREVTRLAAATTGYVRDEILEAVDAFVRTGAEPNPRRSRDEVPVDPDGATHERLFDPFELGEAIAEHGFRSVSVRGYWGGAGGRSGVRLANTLLAAASRLTMRTAKGFRIAAVRM